MPTLHESTTPAETASCRSSASPCAACAKRAGEHVASGSIHSYGSQPRDGWRPRRLADETATPTFGIELETQLPESYGRRADRLNLTGEEAVAVASPRGWWHAQHDGSVSGPELTSQPGSLAYWRSIRPSVALMMRTLIHGGTRSHDGPESCSMHVNIGVDAFESPAHLARFIRLATVNPRWTTRMAQRTHSQVSSWARYDAFPDMSACERHARDFMRDGYGGTGHGAAVNLENRGRVEFRSPRGTLRVDRFYAKLEWVAAMVEFTRTSTARPAVGNFVPWAVEHRTDYPELVAYMRDMTPGRLADRPVTSRTTDAPSATDALMTDAAGTTYTEATARNASTACPDGDAYMMCTRCGTGWGSHFGMFCAARYDGIESVWLAPDRLADTCQVREYSASYVRECTRTLGHFGSHVSADGSRWTA